MTNRQVRAASLVVAMVLLLPLAAIGALAVMIALKLGATPALLIGIAVVMLLVGNGWYQYSRRISRQQPEMARRREAYRLKRSEQERAMEILHQRYGKHHESAGGLNLVREASRVLCLGMACPRGLEPPTFRSAT